MSEVIDLTPDRQPTATTVRHEARAKALAEIQQMESELSSAHKRLDDLEAQLARADDRMVLLCDERDRYRAEANIFRARLIELATAMSNIGLLTQKAQDIMMVVNELVGEKQPAQTERETSTLHAIADELESSQTHLGANTL